VGLSRLNSPFRQPEGVDQKNQHVVPAHFAMLAYAGKREIEVPHTRRSEPLSMGEVWVAQADSIGYD